MDNESQHTPTPADEPLTDDVLEQISGGNPPGGEPRFCGRCFELLKFHRNGVACPGG